MIENMPTVKKPFSSLFTLKSTSSMVENTYNPSVQVGEGDEFWTGELEYKNTDYQQTAVFRSFGFKMRGTAGEFWFVDYAHKQRGTWNGAPVVDGDNQDGILLAVRGLQINAVVGVIGDRFQLGNHIHELTEDAVTDDTGRVSLKFLPDIRFIPQDGDALNVINPRCVCMLYPDQTIAQPTSKKALHSGFKFKFRESLR